MDDHVKSGMHYDPLARRARFLIPAMVIGIVLLTVDGLLLCIYNFNSVLQGGTLYEGTSSGLGLFLPLDQWVVWTIFLLVMISWFVGYASFFFLAMSNLYADNIEGLTVGPSGMWQWHFVPVMNFWKPYQGVIQVYRGSINPQSPKSVEAKIVKIWWFLSLLPIMTMPAYWVLMLNDFQFLLITVDTVLCVLMPVNGYLCVKIVKQITKAQATNLG